MMNKADNQTFFTAINSIYTNLGLVVGLCFSAFIYLILGFIIFIPFYLLGYGEIGSYLAITIAMLLTYISVRKYMLVQGYSKIYSTLIPTIVFSLVIAFIIFAIITNSNYQAPY